MIFLCLGNERGGGVRAAGRRRSCRPRRASTGSPTPALAEHAGTGVSPGAWSYGLPEVHPATGRLIANPGCYATAALLALWPAARGDRRRRRRRRQVGHDRAPARRCGTRSHAGSVLENFAPYAVGGAPPCARRSRRCSACPVTLRPAPPARPPRPARDLLPAKRAPTCARWSRRPTPGARSCGCCRRGSSPRSGACRAPMPPRSASSPTASTGMSIVDLRARQPRQGRGGPGGPERESRARAAGDGRAAARERARMKGWTGERHGSERLRRLGRRRAGSAGRSGKDLAIVRSLPHATGAAMFTRNRVQAACLQVDPRAPRARRPAGGRDQLRRRERRDRRAREARRARDRGRGGAAARPRRRGGARPLDRRDRRAAAAAPAAARPRSGRRRALAETAARDAAEAIMTTDTRAEGGRRSPVDGFTVGGMAKGSGMIHPDLATMLAVVTTDYPLDAARGDRVPPARGRASFNAISVDGEPSTNDCVILLANGASGDRADAGATRRSPRRSARSAPTLARQVVADGEGITVLAEINVTGAADDAQAKAIARRIATSPLVKTALFGHDANWGRVLMAAGSRAVERRLRDDRCRARHAPLQRHRRPRPRRPDRRRARRLRARLHDRPRPRARRRARRLPDDRPLLRLRADQRGLPDMSRLVVKVGGRVAAASATPCPRARRRRQRGVRRPRRRAADLGGDGAGRRPGRVRRRAPRDDAEAGIAIVRASFAAVNEALCAAIGERRRRALRRRDRARGRRRCRSSGSSARRDRRALPALVDGARPPGRSRSSRRSRRAAAAQRERRRRRRGDRDRDRTPTGSSS